jgi:hypothetical protein
MVVKSNSHWHTTARVSQFHEPTLEINQRLTVQSKDDDIDVGIASLNYLNPMTE